MAGAKTGDKQSREMRELFAREFLIDLNATRAAIRAGYSERSAYNQGQRLMKRDDVRIIIQAEMDKRSARTNITQDMVLKRWWEIATANPNDLVQYRHVCCRHCYGVDHEYHWVDEVEYAKALAMHEKAMNDLKAGESAPPMPSDEGGYGFVRTDSPNADCPKCHGEGIGEMHVTDTRMLSGPAALLYAGVKQTRDGLELKMQDQLKALENVARHLGMYNDKTTIKHEYNDLTPEQIEARIAALSGDQ